MSRHPHQSLDVLLVGWLNDLYLATIGGNAPLPDIKARIAVLAAALAKEFPDPLLFTKESLLALSRRNKFFPGYSDLSEQLEAWRKEHRPRTYTGPIDHAELNAAPLSGEDRMATQIWLEHDLNNTLSARDMAMRLAIIRSKHRPGFDWLMANNARARDIAASSGWIREDRSEDFTDPGEILARVRSIVEQPFAQAVPCLRMLRAAVEARAPELVELVPLTPSAVEGVVGEDRRPTPQQSADVRADDGVVLVQRPRDDQPSPPPRPAGTPSPEHILARRLENPLLRPIAEREAAREAERKLSAAAPAGDDDWTPSYLRVVP